MSTNTTDPKKERSRNWFLLLYPDNPDHVKALDKIPTLDWEHVGICHDSDKLDDGTPAKPHHHVLLKFKEATWNTAIADALEIELRFVKKTDNWKRSARYLVHKDHPEKYQYEKTALYGSMVEKAIEAINKSDPEEEAAKVAQLITLIDTWQGRIEMADIVKEICAKKLYAEFRRGGQIFMRMIDSHNYKESCVKRFDIARDRALQGFRDMEEKRIMTDESKPWVVRCEEAGQKGYLADSME